MDIKKEIIMIRIKKFVVVFYAYLPTSQSIKKNLTYYTTNRKIESKGRDYLYYHTSSNKTQCKYPKFNILNPLTKSKFIEKDNINITERRYTTSFPRDFGGKLIC